MAVGITWPWSQGVGVAVNLELLAENSHGMDFDVDTLRGLEVGCKPGPRLLAFL